MESITMAPLSSSFPWKMQTVPSIGEMDRMQMNPSVYLVNGRYSVMLGGQGMNPLPPELFLQHEELYLSVSFDKGDGPRTLGPEQLITATPRALVAEVAKV